MHLAGLTRRTDCSSSNCCTNPALTIQPPADPNGTMQLSRGNLLGLREEMELAC